MARPVNNIAGNKYGFLTAVRYAGEHRWLFKCECGNEKVIPSSYVTRSDGHRTVKSCGCIKTGRKPLHGMSSTRFYSVWSGINDRCYGINSRKYPVYGGKGIISEWRNNFNKFKTDMYLSYLSHVEEHGERNTTIDRIKNVGNYNKQNTRWATYIVQNRNRRNVSG